MTLGIIYYQVINYLQQIFSSELLSSIHSSYLEIKILSSLKQIVCDKRIITGNSTSSEGLTAITEATNHFKCNTVHIYFSLMY